jgi:hypothetical protein
MENANGMKGGKKNEQIEKPAGAGMDRSKAGSKSTWQNKIS